MRYTSTLTLTLTFISIHSLSRLCAGVWYILWLICCVLDITWCLNVGTTTLDIDHHFLTSYLPLTVFWPSVFLRYTHIRWLNAYWIIYRWMREVGNWDTRAAFEISKYVDNLKTCLNYHHQLVTIYDHDSLHVTDWCWFSWTHHWEASTELIVVNLICRTDSVTMIFLHGVLDWVL